MEQCYAVFAKQNRGLDLSAVAPDDIDITEKLYKMVSKDNMLLYDLKLKSVKVTKSGLLYSDDISQFDNIWLDILITNLAVPLFSDKVKDFFNIEGEDYIKWITVRIHGNDDIKTYYVPEFTKRLDVLNIEKCKFYDDRIIVPCFSYKKIQKYVLFHQPDNEEYLWRVPSCVYISDETRKKIMVNKFSGFYYEKIRTSE